MKKLSKKTIEILENNGFNVGEVTEQHGHYYIELNQSTPAGEDWWETIWFNGTSKGFIEGVRERAYNFDVNDEVEPYIECRGERGVPISIRTLVEDAEWKQEALEELYDNLAA